MSFFYNKTYNDYNRDNGNIMERYDLYAIETASKEGKFIFQYDKSTK